MPLLPLACCSFRQSIPFDISTLRGTNEPELTPAMLPGAGSLAMIQREALSTPVLKLSLQSAALADAASRNKRAVTERYFPDLMRCVSLVCELRLWVALGAMAGAPSLQGFRLRPLRRAQRPAQHR